MTENTKYICIPGVSILLALSVYQLIILDKIPASGESVPFLGAYIRFDMFVYTAINLFFVIHYASKLMNATTTQRPGYLSSLIRVNQPTRQLRPSTHRVLCSTAPRTAFASRAFCHAAPVVWNELPNSLNCIHSTVSLSEFKRNLKSFLFKQSFPV